VTLQHLHCGSVDGDRSFLSGLGRLDPLAIAGRVDDELALFVPDAGAAHSDELAPAHPCDRPEREEGSDVRHDFYSGRQE
jgi:hypothetical protein